MRRPVIDSFDAKLLNILQANNLITSSDLAEQVHLSSASCLRRVRRLREEGVIASDVSIVSPELAGLAMTMIVLVTLERERTDLMDNFKRSVLNAPEVFQCYYVTGDFDFVLIVTVRNLSDYEDFTNRFFFDNPNVRRFSTMVVMNRTKFSTSVPVESNNPG
ncbi:Lrp/AsnC family transcriptional regulator [Paracoccus onubensis]|uniref:Lrp/AsnC family transcriptional regulator n=1 Tax=Paracoccus onubensis TaxID=1675788 RepID=UPI00272FECD5|nr:Lrp/AsnC family transcriptional regulator [Paracoccus onubensis]MDP0930311.1 Lrp/AsnC family transcriptional regulator [Paracoccus onubensis]